MQYRAILLNGPSSSGKSTLSRALQERLQAELGQEFRIAALDDFMKIGTDETIYEDDVYEVSPLLCKAVAAHLTAGCSVIIDHVITSQRIYEQLMDTLKNYKVLKVLVTCPLEELLRRETARGNRCIGSAEASFTYLYPKDGYDLTVDTFSQSSEECVTAIGDLLIHDIQA